MRGIPKNVLPKAKRINDSSDRLCRTKRRPALRSTRRFWWEADGRNVVLSALRETITAKNEIPLNKKQATGPNAEKATPATSGPMMRARLNWIELSAM